MFKTRLISASILIPITICMIFLLPIIQFLIVVSIICLISAWEWGKMMRFSDCIHRMWICVIFGLLLIVTTQSFLYFNNWYIFWYIFSSISIAWWILAFLLILSYPDSAIFWKKSNILRFLFGILTILPFFWGILTLRQFHHIDDRIIGTWCLLYVVILIWINDVSAYIIGKTLGKRRLLQTVSPKKTWEGFIGGILISTGISWLFSKYMPIKIINPSLIFIYSIITIIASIIGDLTESMFKRASGIKDSGNLIPGHGGMLDRIDSLVAAVPIFVYLILLNLY
ncbi:phosphatidate cytidylyltransferase [Blochmannia endosymbiont of Camponotus sp. C-003]|uniref:phosphatidate cytidylyltransferase n=1 Tax=unclassified Candidatus Blochmanniella TaxID=711328 RepID=UPI0020254CC3|nr:MULTISPECIES: phosphatidate cytidylyltransferase [unclassified Candidatus Blochmannia]URJ23531.1 phosphatidate cytidylyltransferase [Blochmannia endosymbiont of Camponotus sp. C-003]URJ29003.1 phosphatidate cytidylyltransferase [Blochmannia endosymbiont of Camponotus sp. C-046]